MTLPGRATAVVQVTFQGTRYGRSRSALGTRCYEGGVYEAWAPASEVSELRGVDLPYALP
jgi:hypothetical protein